MLTRDTTIRRLLSARFVWSVLGVICLYLASPLLPADTLCAQASEAATAALTQFDPDASNPLFLEDSPTSAEEFGFQCAQGSKQSPVLLVRSSDFFALVWKRSAQVRSILIQLSGPPLFFLPRKLSPPSADTDPFLS